MFLNSLAILNVLILSSSGIPVWSIILVVCIVILVLISNSKSNTNNQNSQTTSKHLDPEKKTVKKTFTANEVPDYDQLLKEHPNWQEQLNEEHKNLIAQSFTLDIPKLNSLNSTSVKSKVVDSFAIDAKMLIGTKWSRINFGIDSKDSIIEFRENGVFDYEGSGKNNSWEIKGEKLFLYFNNKYSTSTGEFISANKITGTAKNKKNDSWRFEMNLIQKNHVVKTRPANIITNGPKVASPDIKSLIGSSWKKMNYGTQLSDTIVRFDNDGKLIDSKTKNNTWEIKNGQVVLFVNNRYVTYVGDFVNNSTIKGSAKNIKGVTWTFELNRISEINSKVETQTIVQHDNIAKVSPFAIVSQVGYKYKWYSLWHYFPVNKFPNGSLNVTDLEHRNHVFRFKDGNSPGYYAQIMADALIQQFGKEYLAKRTLIIIPASNKLKTENRFKSFCMNLCQYTGLKNGYNILTNNGQEKIAQHLGGNGNILDYVHLNEVVIGMNFMVIDDVRTSGKSSNAVFSYLKEKGANEVEFVYFAKTVSIY